MATGCSASHKPSRAELRRQRITDAARKLFVVNGFHATGMAQLAKESGIAIGQIYRDFQSKEDIVAVLVETNCSRLMMFDQLESAIHRNRPEDVRAWLLDFLDPGDCRDDARLFAEIVAESGRNRRIAAIFRALHDRLREHILAALALLAPSPSLAARREEVTEALMTLSLGLFQYGFMAPERHVGPVLRVLVRLATRELDDLMGETAPIHRPPGQRSIDADSLNVLGAPCSSALLNVSNADDQ